MSQETKGDSFPWRMFLHRVTRVPHFAACEIGSSSLSKFHLSPSQCRILGPVTWSPVVLTHIFCKAGWKWQKENGHIGLAQISSVFLENHKSGDSFLRLIRQFPRESGRGVAFSFWVHFFGLQNSSSICYLEVASPSVPIYTQSRKKRGRMWKCPKRYIWFYFMNFPEHST